jgi:hypothetical protein
MEQYSNVDAFRAYDGTLYCLGCGKPYDEATKKAFEQAEIWRREANIPSRVIPYKTAGFLVSADNQVSGCDANIDSIADFVSEGSCNRHATVQPQ